MIELHGVHRMSLDMHAPDDAAAVSEVLRHCGNLPLALQVAAARRPLETVRQDHKAPADTVEVWGSAPNIIRDVGGLPIAHGKII